ncbi:unnamed protein product [Leptosia nina]|uniref:Uncharacterized protein n=1 Tax=Leptosia nina TaxID=320188 RepID=A0AAV1JAE0_9NEOP
MALKFLERLENPNHPSMGPIIWGLKAAGMWKSDNTLDKAFIVQTFAIITFATEVTELWFLRSDITSALRNISFTTLRLVCVVKSGSFVLWNKCWKEIIEYVSGLEREQLSNPGEGVVQSMELYIRYSRRITYLYWGLTYSTVLAVILSPLVSYFASAEVIRNGSVPYPEIISSWVPFDKTRGCGYAVLILIQAVMLIYGGITVASYDSNAVALMTFFAGQLNILRENCKGLFDGNISKESSMKKIRGYHKNYVDLIK